MSLSLILYTTSLVCPGLADSPRVGVVVTMPAEIDLIALDRAYDQLYAAFASGAVIVIADFRRHHLL